MKATESAAASVTTWTAAASFVLLTACAHVPSPPAQQTLIGAGHGIDHVTVMTDSLAAASATYSDRLGFTITPYGQYPNGFENAVAYFSDRSFVELFGVHDRVKAAASQEAYALDVPEGLLWNSLHVDSMQRAVSFLRSRGENAFGPETFPSDAAEGQWSFRTGGLKDPALGGRFMLIEWNDSLPPRPKDPARERRKVHANTAQRLHSVWIAVRNLDAAARRAANLGLPAGRPIEFPTLRAVGHEIAAGSGTIVLLQPADERSEVAAFLGSRDDAYMGVSVEVADLRAARELLAAKTGESFPEYQGLSGRSIAVPSRLAHGVWIELFEP